MKPEITADFENYQYEIHLDGKIRYVSFIKSSQIEEVMQDMMIEMRNKKIDSILKDEQPKPL